MARIGKRITVVRSVVTDLKIAPTGFATLFVYGVDQSSAGGTLASHQLSFPPEVLPPDIAAAVQAIRDFAQHAIDDA